MCVLFLFLGSKDVISVVKNKNATTHSFTLMPLVKSDGTLLLPLYVVLQETNGKFGPNVAQSMFKSDLLCVTASASGRLFIIFNIRQVRLERISI